MNKEYTFEDFKNGKIIVSFKNEREYNSFLRLCDSKGVCLHNKISLGEYDEPDIHNAYHIYKDKTVAQYLRGTLYIFYYEFYKELGFTIVPFSKLQNGLEIVITTNDYNTVWGVMKENGKVVKKGETNFNLDEDVFSFETGAKLVLSELFKKKPLNATIECVNNVKNFTKGKLYDIKEGRLINDNGDDFGYVYYEGDDVNINFVEIKEIQREANVGEYVKVIEEVSTDYQCYQLTYKTGDICKVKKTTNKGYVECENDTLLHQQYVVLEGYKPVKSKIKKIKFHGSGQCLCDMGIKTHLKDINHEELYTGDVVEVFDSSLKSDGLLLVATKPFFGDYITGFAEDLYVHDGRIELDADYSFFYIKRKGYKDLSVGDIYYIFEVAEVEEQDD